MGNPWDDFKKPEPAAADVESAPWEEFGGHKPKHSAVATAGMHGLQGLTAGFMDELQGAGEAAGRVVGVEGAGGPMKDMGFSEDGPTLDWETLRDAYRMARNKERATLKEQSEERPGLALGANLTGSVLSPVNKLAKGASLVKAGAGLGAVNALGNSEKETASGMLADTADGAVLGAVLGKGGQKLEEGAQKLGAGAKDLAKRFGARALGAERGTIKSIGHDKVMSAAEQALEQGVISPLASTDDLVSRNAAVKQKGGELMGKAYDAIDEAGASTFNPLDVASKVDEKIGGFYRSPINKGETNQLENTLEAILMRGDKNIPIKEAQALKEELAKVANWKNRLNITDKEKMARDAYGVVSKQIDEAVSSGSAAIDKAGLSETLKTGKDLFSKASTADALLENKVAREQGNKLFGLTDTITGGAALGYGGVTDDWKGAAGLMAAKKGLEKYGAGTAAVGLNKVANFLMKKPEMAKLASSNPKAFSALVADFSKRVSPQGAGSKVAQTPEAEERNAKQSFVEGN